MEAQLVITLVNVFGLVMVALLTYMNKRAIHEVHLSLNGRLSEFIQMMREDAHREGFTEGTRQEKDKINNDSPPMDTSGSA